MERDVQWRTLHGAIASSRRLVKMSFHNTETCLFCNELEDLNHICIDFPRMVDLTRHLSSYLRYTNFNSIRYLLVIGYMVSHFYIQLIKLKIK